MLTITVTVLTSTVTVLTHTMHALLVAQLMQGCTAWRGQELSELRIKQQMVVSLPLGIDLTKTKRDSCITNG